MSDNNLNNKIESSIYSLYAESLEKRKVKKEEDMDRKRKRKEEKEDEEIKIYGKKLSEMTKKEKKEALYGNWKQALESITGEEIDVEKPKKKKKKYRKWILDDDTDISIKKKKKPKKKNYSKEFEPELNMLRTLISEQNKFTSDLQKRFLNAVGPATKDGSIPNKTMVDLASAVMTGRSNSLGMLREIGNLKKNIADLTMKQKKMDSEIKGVQDIDNTDLALLGSSIMASNSLSGNPYIEAANKLEEEKLSSRINIAENQDINITPFNPDEWIGPNLGNNQTLAESIPHTIEVEKNLKTGDMRFVARRNDTGEEFFGIPLPSYDMSKIKINEKDMTAKGEFDEIYRLKYVE